MTHFGNRPVVDPEEPEESFIPAGPDEPEAEPADGPQFEADPADVAEQSTSDELDEG